VSEHWFDRFAVPQTRRSGFKLALSGALATLPLTRSVAEAQAAAPPCVKPCLYVNQIEKGAALNDCRTGFFSGYIYSWSLFWTAAAPTTVPLAAKDYLNKVKCDERARTKAKAGAFDCINKANCGGFDPVKNKDVLCPGCTEVSGQCCPAPNLGTPSGYVCCGGCCQPGEQPCGACG
jgi:hypothetical protein